MNRQIEVWYDGTSDADAPVWCVSLCDEGGQEIKCLSTHANRAEAVQDGREKAQRCGLRLFGRDVHGAVTDLLLAKEVK